MIVSHIHRRFSLTVILLGYVCVISKQKVHFRQRTFGTGSYIYANECILKKYIVISTFFWCTIYIYINIRWLENTNTEVYKSLINDCNKLYTYYIILQPFMSSASPSKPNMATYLKKKLEQTKLPHGQLKTILKQNQNSKIHVKMWLFCCCCTSCSSTSFIRLALRRLSKG